MALVNTTLSSALGASDTLLTPAATTGFAAGSVLRIGGETLLVGHAYQPAATPVAVIRAQGGTVAQAHPSGATVTVGTASEFAAQAPQTVPTYPIAGRARTVASYSAAGAIALPSPGADAIAVINGTNALAMTLASPTKDMDGSMLIIIGNGKAAHTVAPAAAINDAGSDFDTAITFAAGGKQVVALIAVAEFWCIFPSVAAGTLTNVSVTYS